ncbi:hypothetical protein pipiens_017789 [Culex pipiens pipiens]|uniref:Integrin beta n=2 Tax=Culex pipiens TaxID=7175 RepID=A0ABD1CEY4_CULPP
MHLISQDNVKSAKISSNLDGPEGSLDALLQAVVCRDEIGWRTQARRLLLLSTDGGFHYAGDGKLAGLIVPNDGECHLNSRNLYTHSTLQDYPSISQVNQKVQDNQINVIFAVTENQLAVYEGLARLIDGASAAMLSNDSSNIVSLVYEQYNKISSSIEMKDNHIEGLLDIKYFSACKDNVRKQRNKCDELKQNQMVQFEVEITLLRCPANPQEWSQVLKISPVGIDESLTVNLELLCGCPCEGTGQKNAAECSGVGTLQCGVCNCGTSFKGEKCECSAKDVDSMDPNACRPTNTSSVCNERGLCKCGMCECYKRENPEEQVTGKYCECDNFSCERIDGVYCSGLKQGRCVCGQCECNPGWTGPSCGCSTSEDTCKPEGGDEVCSGHGTCECGACKCKKTQDGRFSGRYCEKCVTCPGLRCNEYESCVLCRQFKTGPWSEAECSANCSSLSLQSVGSLEPNEEAGDKRCTFSHNQCRYEFMYNEYANSEKLIVLEKPDCPAVPLTLGFVLIVVGAVVLLGLAALLVWKLVTSVCDRREYARFEQERANAKFDESDNPLYKEPTSTFQNPTFADKMAGEGATASQLRG